MAARLALSSRHPLAAAVAREARERAPYPDAIEEPGQGVRALIERNRSAPRQSRLLRQRRLTVRPPEPGTSADRVSPWRPQRRLRRPPDLAARCRRGGEITRRARSRPAHPVRRPAGGGGAGRRRARHRAMAGRARSGAEDRGHRGAESRRAAASSWSATASTTRRRSPPLMSRCRRSAPPTSPRRRPTRCFWASGSRRCSTRCSSPAAPAA